MSAQDQVSRLLALVPYVLSNPGVGVSEVAEMLGVSERQLVDDLRVLWFTGLPELSMGDLIEVDMEAVKGEGVIHVSNAPYLARPIRLGTDEAIALLVALRTIAATPGLQDTDVVNRTIAKLERAVGALADRAAQVSVEVDAGTTVDVAATIRQAVQERRRLHLSYWVPGRDETTERDVDPMRLFLADGRLYLEGWCRRAESVRLFRLDRVAAARLLDLPADVPPHAKPRDLSAGVFQPSPDDEIITLELEPPGRWVADYYPCEGVEALAGDRLRVRLRTADDRWVRRLMLRLGEAGRVVDPPRLAEDVRAAAREALAAYET